MPRLNLQVLEQLIGEEAKDHQNPEEDPKNQEGIILFPHLTLWKFEAIVRVMKEGRRNYVDEMGYVYNPIGGDDNDDFIKLECHYASMNGCQCVIELHDFNPVRWGNHNGHKPNQWAGF